MRVVFRCLCRLVEASMLPFPIHRWQCVKPTLNSIYHKTQQTKVKCTFFLPNCWKWVYKLLKMDIYFKLMKMDIYFKLLKMDIYLFSQNITAVLQYSDLTYFLCFFNGSCNSPVELWRVFSLHSQWDLTWKSLFHEMLVVNRILHVKFLVLWHVKSQIQSPNYFLASLSLQISVWQI